MIAISAAITERIVRMVQMKLTVQVSASHLPNEIDIDCRNLDGRNVKTYIYIFFFPVVCKDDEFMCGDEVGKRLVRM